MQIHFYIILNLFNILAALGLSSVHGPSLVALNEGYSSIVVPRPLTEVASLTVQHGLQGTLVQ